MNATQRDQKPLTFYDMTKAYNGYTLYAPAGGDDVWLIDMKGRFIHNWKLPYLTTGHGVLLPNGNLLFVAKVTWGPLAEFDGARGELLEIAWDGKVVWKYEDLYMHDDFHRMRNGHTIVARWVPTPTGIATKVKGGLVGTEREGTMWSDCFREINPRGKVLWEWLGYEHLDPEVDIICPLCPRSEWTQANSVVALPDGNILASFVRTNTVVIIDKVTGNIKWRWGSEDVGHQHNASITDSGNVLIFDSGTHSRGIEVGYSRLLEVNTTTDEAFWEFSQDPPASFYAPCMGNCQRLANGNTLICEGDTGRIFEITSRGNIVWEFINPFYHSSAVYGRNNMLFRAYRYGYDYMGLRGKFSLVG